MKEQTLQIVLRNKKDFDDIIKIRLVEPEYVKMNISKIIKKMTTNIYELKKIRLRNHNVVDILRVKKRKDNFCNKARNISSKSWKIQKPSLEWHIPNFRYKK